LFGYIIDYKNKTSLTFLQNIKKFERHSSFRVRVVLAPSWNKLTLRREPKNLHAVMAKSTRLVMLIKNIYTLRGRKRFLLLHTFRRI